MPLKANLPWIMKNNALGNFKEMRKHFLNTLEKNWILLWLSPCPKHYLSKEGVIFFFKGLKNLKIFKLNLKLKSKKILRKIFFNLQKHTLYWVYGYQRSPQNKTPRIARFSLGKCLFTGRLINSIIRESKDFKTKDLFLSVQSILSSALETLSLF